MPSSIAATTNQPTRVTADVAAEKLLRHDHWEGARGILRDVFRPHARVAVKGCHASGKTFAAADAVLLALFDGADVITTAPTDDQVRGIMWRYIHSAIADSPVTGWGDLLQTQITTPDGFVALGRSTNKGVRFQGYHARDDSYLLIILDEGPGIEPGILEAIEGVAAAGDVRMLMLGNPTETSGPFYDAFSSPLWRKWTISAWDMPNLAGVSREQLLAMSDAELEINVRPYLATRRWVRDRCIEWDEDGRLYRARVLGEFPLDGSDALIWRQWIDQAAEREPEARPGTGMTAGIDVAGPGEDLTTCVIRRGTDIISIVGWSDADPRDAVIAHLRQYVHAGLKQVHVDSIGVGWYFYLGLADALKATGTRVVPVNVALPSHALNDAGQPQYANLKAEYYWALRQAMMDGQMTSLHHAEARQQLATLRYGTTRGLIAIESKEDATKRGVKSPDYAEAMMLAWAPIRATSNLYGQETPVAATSKGYYR